MTKEDDASRNRRRSPRARARIRILFTRAGASIGMEAETDDISLDGAFVRTQRRPPDVGTKLGLILKFEEDAQELMLNGVVARVREEAGTEANASAGMGIHFVDMHDDARKALRRALEGTGAYEAVPETEGGD
jgi:uncharacterized protein (TIGR02266 family)